MTQKILTLALISLCLFTACTKKKSTAAIDQAVDPDESTSSAAISAEPSVPNDAPLPTDGPNKNKLDDVNPVAQIEADIATLEKPMPELKAGDFMYFPREPYRFAVISVDEKGIVKVKLGARHDVKEGQMLMKYATESIKKNISTLNRLDSVSE